MTPIDKGSMAPTALETLTKPKLRPNLPPSPPLVSQDFLTIQGSHNTYRPDIYRTTEGFLN